MTVSQPSEVPPVPGRFPEIWGKVPQQNKNFTGRDELLGQLHGGAPADVTAVVPHTPHALHGLGGVGKTQVAIEYAYRFRSEYDLVWWIPADRPELVRSSLAGLASHLGLPPATATGIDDAAEAVLDALRRGQPYKRWLLIFDNADQPEEINEIVPRGPGHVLITSRNQRWDSVVDTISIDVFTRTESVAFLNKRVPRAVNADEADRLAEQLGDLPLALEQAGALLSETGMSVEEYLRQLSQHAQTLLAEGKPTEYPQSMTAVWALSVSQLSAKLPEAVDVLRCCAFFGPEPIPRDVFAPIPPDFGESALSGLLDNPILLSRAIRELGRFALAKVESRSRTIQVHRLIQALIRAELNDDETRRVRQEVHYLLAGATPGNPDDTAAWPRYQSLVGHIRPTLIAQSDRPAVRTAALNVLRYLYSSGDFEAGRTFADEFIEAWAELSGPEHPDVLVARRHLGALLRELSEPNAAFELNRRTLEVMNRVLSPEHEETLRLTNSHGADIRAAGDFRGALEHDKESRRRHEEAFGANDRRTLRTINNLAIDYALISDYRTARELHEAAYRQSVSGVGVSVQDTVNWLNGLARAVRLIGEYNEAVDLGEDAFGLSVQELGVDHHWTLRTAKDLSIAQRRNGLADEGYELARETFEREERILGFEHQDTLAAAMSLANAMRARDEIDDALALAHRTMDRYPYIYGPDHPFNQGCTINLALLFRAHGDFAEARTHDEAALAALKESVGWAHHFTLTCAVNLASDLAETGDPEAARRLGQRAFDQLQALLGERNPLTIACAANLSIDMETCGEQEEAERLRRYAFELYAQVLGPEHPDTVVATQRSRLDFDFDPPPL
ncbi:hypothetical protein GCM10010411_32180 [Actinomadura fulvescens]|uniref:DUF7779 domain-containing protein n=1 Tax=Actinomadura fulvescens TaxID=46160 RepID=A0ABN3PPH7_9ACTN